MAKKSRNLTPALRRTLIAFVERLQARAVPFVHVYIFGSTARGTQTANSDLDICVLLSDSVKRQVRKFWLAAMGAATDLMLNADVVVYTQTDFETNEISPLIHEIKRNHIRFC